MVFSSASFLFFFLPVTLLLYYLCPAWLRNFLLVVASLVFYAWGEPVYILIMLFSTVFDYVNGRLIGYFTQKEKYLAKRAMLILSVVGNLGILCFFKYTNLFIDTINSMTNLGISGLELALPIGISFYTFQTMSYTIDVYRGEVQPQKDMIAFATYVTCFPQLVAGPIVRYIDLEAQLKNRRLDAENIAQGCRRFCIGMCKKVLLANNAGAIWDSIQAMEVSTIPVLTAWIGAMCFTFQIYFDFSGYSDMAIGLGKMFGFTFPENFNLPYTAKSITDFWRRWHISLSSWFKEYVYIPLGGNRKGTKRQIVNLLIVWGLTGFWHGAAYNFLLWGLYYGVLLIIEKFLLDKWIKKAPSYLLHIYTMFFVVIGWVLFAYEDFAGLIGYVKAMFGFNNQGLYNGESIYFIVSHFVLFVICILSSTNLAAVGKAMITKCKYQKVIRISLDVLLLGLFLLSICFVIGSSYNPFLYFRF